MPSYRLGRLPGQVPVGLRDLTYYAAGPLPKAPASVAVPAVADWLLLANGPDPTCPEYPQGVGDCGVAGLEHGFMSAAADTSERETFPDAERAVSYYFGYTGGQDSGVVLSQYLAHVRQNGYYGHTVAAYAPVAVHDVPTLQFAINAYDFAYVGITVTQGMMDAADGPGTVDVDRGVRPGAPARRSLHHPRRLRLELALRHHVGAAGPHRLPGMASDGRRGVGGHRRRGRRGRG